MELMVSLVAGLIAIVWIYALGASSSRFFQEQQRIAQTQTSLRSGMEQLRADVARAGVFGTPNSALEQNQACTPNKTAMARLAAIEFIDNAGLDQIPEAVANGARSDVIRLIGNYATQAGYMITGTDPSGGMFYLQRNWQAFRRDFGTVGTEAYTAAFTDVFAPGRVLHITTLQGNHFFSRISGINLGQATVSVTPPIGVGGLCVQGLADGATIAPLSRIEYRILDARTTPELSRLMALGDAASETARGLQNSVLVRREIAFDDAAVTAPTVVNGSWRVVLEYAVDLDFGFMLDTQLTPGNPAILQSFVGAAAQTEIAARPHQVRSVQIDLAARTADQDARFNWIVQRPMVAFRANPAAAGASRVRSLRTEVFLPNLANRMMR
jgi:hypothetical protein